MNITFTQYKKEDENLWEEINKSAKNSTFLTAADWIDFQKSYSKTIDQFFINLKIGEQETSFGILYIEIYKRKMIRYAYAPYNPVFDFDRINEYVKDKIGFEKNTIESLKNFFKKYIKENNLTLFRLDPFEPKSKLALYKMHGFRSSLAPAQAKNLWEIDLTHSEEDLRSNMSKSTRYNINKGLRTNIDIFKAETEDHVKQFSDLMKATTQRKGFSNFDFSYFNKQFQSLNQKGITDIYIAEFNGKPVAGALINYFKDTAYYTHGCSISDRELSKLRAPYPLQWKIMTELKNKGFKKYNMWGVLPENVKKHPQTGVSSYKKSFGGYELDLIGAVEIYNNSIRYLIHRLIDWQVYKKDRYKNG